MQSVTKPQTQDICEGEKICILCTIEQLFSTTHGSQDCDKVDAEKSLPDFVRGIVGATDHDQSGWFGTYLSQGRISKSPFERANHGRTPRGHNPRVFRPIIVGLELMKYVLVPIKRTVSMDACI